MEPKSVDAADSGVRVGRGVTDCAGDATVGVLCSEVDGFGGDNELGVVGLGGGGYGFGKGC